MAESLHPCSLETITTLLIGYTQYKITSLKFFFFFFFLKNKIIQFAATWLDLQTVKRSEVSQIQKDKYDIAYMWNLKGV